MSPGGPALPIPMYNSPMRTMSYHPWIALVIGSCVGGTVSAQTDNSFVASLHLDLGAALPSLVGATLVQDAPPVVIDSTSATPAPQDAGALARKA